MRLIARVVITAIGVWLAAYLLPDLEVEGGLASLLLVAIVFGLVNLVIRPVARLLSFPITVLTLGLFTFVINGLMLLLTAALVDDLTITGGFVRRLVVAIVGAIIISLISLVLGGLVRDKDD